MRKGREQSWAVTVERNGESLVTIASNMLGGKPEFSDDEAQTIRKAGEHLLAFIGAAPKEPDWIGKCPDCGETVLNHGDRCDRCEAIPKATEIAWPQDAAGLIEMADEWPVPTTDAGDMFSGDVLIKKLGRALKAAVHNGAR